MRLWLLGSSAICLLVLAGFVYAEPTWSSMSSSTPVSYNRSTYSRFYVLWNGTVDQAFIEGNWSGAPKNYSMILENTSAYSLTFVKGSSVNYTNTSLVNLTYESLSIHKVAICMGKEKSYDCWDSQNASWKPWLSWFENSTPFNQSVFNFTGNKADDQDFISAINFSLGVEGVTNVTGRNYFYLVPNISWWDSATELTDAGITGYPQELSIYLYNFTSGNYNLVKHKKQTMSGHNDGSCLELYEPIKIYSENIQNSQLNVSVNISQGGDSTTDDGVWFTDSEWFRCGGYNFTPTTYSPTVYTVNTVMLTFRWNLSSDEQLTNYSYSEILPAGNFSWKSYANDTTNIFNETSSEVVVINKTGYHLFVEIAPYSYAANGTVGSYYYGGLDCYDNPLTDTLYKNGSQIAGSIGLCTGTSGGAITHTVGVWNYTAVGTSQNHSQVNTTIYYVVPLPNVTKASASPAAITQLNDLYINISVNDTLFGFSAATIDIYDSDGVATNLVNRPLALLSGNSTAGVWGATFNPTFCSETKSYYVKYINLTSTVGLVQQMNYSSTNANFAVACIVAPTGGGTPTGGGGTLPPIIVYNITAGGCGVRFEPSIYTDFLQLGGAYTKEFKMTNIGNESCKGTVSVIGNETSWVTLSSSSLDLMPSQSQTLAATINIPEDAVSKSYSWQIVAASGSQGGTATITLYPGIVDVLGSYWVIIIVVLAFLLFVGLVYSFRRKRV